MKYLAHYMKTEFGELNRNNVRLEVIGQIHRLPEFVQKQLKKTQDALAKNNGLTLIMALSYGGRTEIVEAVRHIAQKSNAASSSPPRSPSRSWPTIYTRANGPTRMCSSAPAAKCA